MKTRVTKLVSFFILVSFMALSANLLASSKDGKTGNQTPFTPSLQKIEAGESLAKVFSTDKGTSGLTFENPYNPGHTQTTWGGTFKGEVDGQDAKFYCIDLQHGIGFYTDQNQHKYTDEGPTSAEITYVLNNYYPYLPYPYAGAASSEGKEAAAVQITMWHYADGLDATTMTDGDVKTRALEIIADADANAANFVPLETLIMIPTNQTIPNGTAGSFTVSTFDMNGTSLGGIPVTLSTTSGTLSSTAFSTGSNGSYGPVSLTQGNENSAEVTAIADVTIPHGTKYFHVTSPNTFQKLVLATPAGVQRTVKSYVNWYQQGTGGCDLNGYTTYTQGGWGSPSNSTPGQVRDLHFDTVFPGGLTIGTNFTLTLTDAAAVKAFLPSGSTASALDANYTDPGNSYKNILAAQVVAMTLNVEYDAAGKIGTNGTDLGNLVFASGDFIGMSVYDFLVIANKALGGENTGYTFSQINDAATAVNENFDNGTVDEGDLTCEVEVCESTIGNYVWHDKDLDGKQDGDETGIPNVKVELYDGSSLLTSTTTDNNGKYEFASLADGDYTVKIADENFNSGGPLYHWYATRANYYSDDEKDSDGDKVTHSADVTVDCYDDLSIDFGFFLVCLEFEKTGPATAEPGDEITYEFTVHNCGDVKLGGGVTVYDELINPNGDHKIWYSTVNAGQTITFSKTYTVTEDNCGDLINTAKAVGHPADVAWSNAQDIIVFDSWTTFIDCEEPCVGQIGDKVWLDYSDEGGENNCNGVQNYGEAGIFNVKIILKDAQGTELDFTFTDQNGSYLFSDLCDGTYLIEIDETTVPEGYTATLVSVGGDSEKDSNPNPTTVVLEEGSRFNLSVDFGFCVPENEEADLRLLKEASSSTAEDGDQITFTVTVINDGPGTANNVQVTDVLPTGLEYVSDNSLGSYNVNSGIWMVGTLAANATASLQITVNIDIETVNTTYFDLGPATGFNVFAWEDVDQPSSDTEGKMAVGRNATLGYYSVGDKLPYTSGPDDVLIVGNNLTYTSGAVLRGNIVYGNSTNLPINQVSIADGGLRQDNPIDFNAAKSYFFSLSAQLKDYTANGTTEFQWGGINLTGTDPFLNVFDVDGDDLSGANSVAINVPNGSVVLVNVSNSTVSWSGGLTVTGTDIGNVLYNFYQATDLTIQGIDVRGSVLAPMAVLNFPAGVINGQVICKSIFGAGQFNNQLFVGNIPVETIITNIAEITFSDLNDPDSTPNNGVDTEDDYDSATITINAENNGGGSTGGGTAGGTWQSVSSFGITEIVYSMANDVNGNILAGTWGGKIYRQVGSEWEIVNASMNVAFIWKIEVTDFGYIFVATEKGIFLSTDNATTWTLMGLSEYDVRDIIIDSNGYFYAGTWGGGIFISTDNGENWTAMNEGLINTAINSLAVTSNNTLFAATFGTGIVRYNNSTNAWEQLTESYSVVWTIEADGNTLYAGTYGAGLQVSTDLGDTWTNASGLSATYIYSIVLDATGNLYVSSWAAGVYMASAAPTPNFSSVGLGGAGVSSILVDRANSKLYAGTKDGQIYELTNSSVTGIDDATATEELPKEFGLEQNYPNPFNPTTNVKFSIADAGVYQLKIYNIIGEEVATLLNEEMNVGNYTITFEASQLSSGIYIYQLVGNNVNMVKKMILSK